MSFIMQMRPLFGEEEKRAISEYMDEDGFITEFKRTEEFEGMIAEFTGAKHCIVVNNGTISLTLAALASGIVQGDEVIVPNYTMIATPNSLKLIGATPVFVDVEPETLCLDIELVKKAITPKTRAIMFVSANGRHPSSGIEAFESLAEEKGLLLLEDSAQALGSYYPDGRHVGRAGLIGSFSFSAPKIISTGQGGALITDDDSIALKIRKLKDFGREAGGSDVHDSIGFNFKFTELQACIGIEQMKKLVGRVQRKKDIYSRYLEGLADIAAIKLFANDAETTAPWFYDMLADNRSELMVHLKSKGIGTRVMYPPINQQIAYNLPGSHPISEVVGAKGLWLPSMVQLSNDQIDYICAEIRNFYGRC
jgi:perosamine synthetase